MYGIFTNISPINEPNVDKYTIHGSYGNGLQYQKKVSEQCFNHLRKVSITGKTGAFLAGEKIGSQRMCWDVSKHR